MEKKKAGVCPIIPLSLFFPVFPFLSLVVLVLSLVVPVLSLAVPFMSLAAPLCLLLLLLFDKRILLLPFAVLV